MIGKGFKVLFDGLRIYVKLDPFYTQNTRGLCGTYNYKSVDDFALPIGIAATEINEFVDAYKTDDTSITPPQVEPCEENIAVGIALFL